MAKRRAVAEVEYFSDGVPVPEEPATYEEEIAEEDVAEIEEYVAGLAEQEEEEQYEVGLMTIRAEMLRMAIDTVGTKTINSNDMATKVRNAQTVLTVARLYEDYVLGLEASGQ